MIGRGIIFDLDGTLVDSAPSILRALSEMLENQGIKPKVPLDQCLIGPPLQKILLDITGFSSGDNRLSVLMDQFKLIYDESYCWQANPYQDVKKIINQIMVDHNLLIATNKRKYPTKKILEHLSWSRCFDEAFCIDERVPPFECKADILDAVIKKNALKKDLIIYIGDRGEDLLAARACGVAFGLAEWGYHDLEKNPIPGDDFYRFSTPNEILDIL